MPLTLLYLLLIYLQSVDGHVQIIEERKSDGTVALLAVNRGHCPYTVTLDVQLTNVTASVPLPITEVVNPGRGPHEMAMLTPKKNAKWSYRSDYRYQMGDTEAIHDGDQIYMLPFAPDSLYMFMQGPHGSFSHQNSHAYDFGMRQGSGVHAARAGIVAYVRKDSQKGCPDRSCLEDANSILINHSDGSFASYAHLQYQGSLVEPGDSVQQGQLIGYSGNTGWSSAPHLHFEVFVARRSGRSTLPVRFQTQNGPTENLHEGDSYRRSRR